ncbi:MAG: nucleotidyltransferase family protein [Oscillibacter sp.]|jgi:predicted nucleotidyltransferase|nr:nucleotidyltransferase family protein [Oscillibacter sp.]
MILKVAGIIAEYNLLHRGHLRQIAQTRERLGPGCAVVCAMSGNFAQRGDFAAVRKHARAEAALRSGADLVLELPLPWAVSSAEGFADGGVQVLAATGVVTHLSFGSESGDLPALRRVAGCLCGGEFPPVLREEMASGSSFAAARQRAVAKLLGGEDAELLRRPNDILGIEYCKSLLRLDCGIEPVAVRRTGAEHDAPAMGAEVSASAIRQALRRGEQAEALAAMAPAMRQIFLRESAAGRAPVFAQTCERAMLARLRFMTREDFAALDESGEGLGNRFYEMSRTAASLPELLSAVKTKRYAFARLRRMVLWAYLGLTRADVPRTPPYLRVLAANPAGCALLARMRGCAAVPVLTKPADVRLLSQSARELFALEVRATDLYTLAYPELGAAASGAEWRAGPVIL